MPAALRRLPEPVVATAGLVGLLLLAYLMPGPASGYAHTPASVLVGGAIDGLTVALATLGIVLVYSTIRVINFAQTALGVAGAGLCFLLMQLSGLPFPLAFVIGIAVGLGTGTAFHLIFGTRFARSPRLVMTLMTVFAGTFLAEGASGLIDQLPILPPQNLRPLDIQGGNVPLTNWLPLPHWTFSFSNYPEPFGFAQVFAAVAAAVVIGAVVFFLRFSRIGRALRASAENAERASLLGISVGLMSLIVWTLSGGLSTLGALLQGFEYKPAAVLAPGPVTLLIPLTAAVLARMRSLWTAIALTVGLTVMSETVGFQNPAVTAFFDLGLLLLLVGGLLLRGRSLSRLAEESTSWHATAEIRPVPSEMSGLLLLRLLKWGAVVVGLVAMIAAPVFLSIGAVQELGVIMLTGVIALSVVMLTGWAGQASFGQYAIAAVGSLTAAWLSSKVGLTAWLAIPIAVLVSVGVGSLLAFPALRIKGIFLVAVTFAFAIVARGLLFDPNYFGWLQPGIVKRPSLFILDFADDRWMYGLAAATLLVSIVVVRNLRRSRFGRLAIASRENEASLEASGVSGVRTKIAVFAASGALAGLGGALLAYEQFGVAPGNYDPQQSLIVFEMAIVGGVSSVWGGLIGVAVIYGLNLLGQQIPGVQTLLPAVPLVILYVAPGGLLGAAATARDAVLRIVASRNKLIVPSLYGDVTPEALQMQLIPLAPPSVATSSRGFQLLWSRLSAAGGRPTPGLAKSREAAAIGAAALAAQEPEEQLPEGVA
jgi:ABC-type branched-subunit amino acid transport system permease subunit